jgi:hypothetical protein
VTSRRLDEKLLLYMTSTRYLTKSRFKLAAECPTKLFYTGKDKVYKNNMQEDSFLAMLADGCSGVVNSGEEGDSGNEGVIVIDSEGPIEIPTDERSNYEDGAYLVYLSLSKVSIEFTFEPADGSFDRDKFAEVSVPINLPAFIEHQTYGRPDFNFVTDYLYDGESIEEYDHDLVDLGYNDLISFFVVKSGKSKLIYTSQNGEETWH